MPGVYERDIPLRDLARADNIAQTRAHNSKFFSALKKAKRLAQLDYQWQLARRKVTGHEGVADGQDQTEFDKQERTPLKMRSQEMREGYKVTQKTDYTDQIAGKEVQIQKAEASIRLKEKVQSRLLSDATPLQEVPGSQVDEMAGIFWYFFNAVSDYVTIPTDFRVPAACTYNSALASFTEKSFEAMVAQAFIDTNGDDIMLDGWVGINLKNRFNDFGVYDTDGNGADNLRQFTFNGEAKKILRCVDFLHISEGVIRLHPTTYLLRDKVTGLSHADAHRSGVFLDMSQWYFHFNQMFTHKENTNEGGGPRGHWSVAGLMRPATLAGQMAIRCTS